MIVQPDFTQHWKTRLLVEITGDLSSPLCVIEGWSHCQHARRSFFPDMTREQLASVCRWGNRKPACHIAMVKAGFVDRLQPKGFAFHEWNEHNAQLLQKWEAGQKGGRPAHNGKTEEIEKPTGNRPLTGTKPDQIRSDQTRPDQIEKTDPIRPDRPEAPAGVGMPNGETGATDGSDSAKVLEIGSGGLEGLAKGIASKLLSRADLPADMEQGVALAQKLFPNVPPDVREDWVTSWFTTMEERHWKDKNGQRVQRWEKHLQAYCNACWRSARKASTA